ncbi:MAG: Gfo/Idh/MocA family protein [Verrucomicrobiales bacterium]
MKRRSFGKLAGAASLAGLVGSARGEGRERHSLAVIGHSGRGDYGHEMDTLWRRVPEVRVVALSDPEAKGRVAAMQRVGEFAKEVTGFSDYREMLSKVKPALVSIAPRHVDQHAEMLAACVEAGVRGVYLEKPMCATLAEADRMVALCERSGLKLALAHRWRYHPVLPVLRKLLDEGLVGKILEVRLRGKEDGRGGLQDAWVLGSHEFVVARALFGDPVGCSAQLFQGERLAEPRDVRAGGEGIPHLAGNALHARFDLADGTPLFFDSVAGAGTREAGFGLQIVGNAGVLDLRIDQEPFAHFRAGNPFNPREKKEQGWQIVSTAGVGKAEAIPQLSAALWQHLLPVADLLASLDDPERQPLCDAREGRLTVEMIHAMMRSHVRGGARVEMPLAEREAHPFETWS